MFSQRMHGLRTLARLIFRPLRLLARLPGPPLAAGSLFISHALGLESLAVALVPLGWLDLVVHD